MICRKKTIFKFLQSCYVDRKDREDRKWKYIYKVINVIKDSASVYLIPTRTVKKNHDAEALSRKLLDVELAMRKCSEE